jgi:pSer/pThr/pTyr-binding forkhead associated (FHA) protein
MGRSDLWCDKGIVVSVQGPNGLHSQTIEKPFALIGSHPTADVALPDPRVAMRDVYLHATEAGVFCLTLTAHRAATKRTVGWLEPEQTFRLGAHRVSARLAVEHPPSAHPPLPLNAKSLVFGLLPIMSIAFDGREVLRRPLRRRLTLLGRTQPSALRIKSSDLSTAHLVLYWDKGVLWAIDLRSRVGTWLDGEAIDAAPFRPGATLHIGEVELTFAGQTEADKQAWSSEMRVPESATGDSEPDEGPSRSDDAISLPDFATEPKGDSQPQPDTVVESPASADERRLELETLRQALIHDQQNWLDQQHQLESLWQTRTDELAGRQAALAAEEKKHRDRYAECETLREQLERERRQIALDRAGVEADRAALQNDRAALEAQRVALAEDTARARDALDAQRRELDLLCREFHEEQQELDLQRTRLDDQHANLRRVEMQIAADRASGEAQLRQQVAALQGLRAELESAQVALRKQQEAWTSRQQELWNRLDERTAELVRQHAALEGNREPLDGVSDPIEPSGDGAAGAGGAGS